MPRTARSSVELQPDAARGLPGPRCPEDLRSVDLTENARTVLTKRYVRRDDDGQPAESVEEMFWRVAYHVAEAESELGRRCHWRAARTFYDLLTSKRFFPNSPTFTGAGTPLGQLAACFVLPITDDMGRDSAGIFQTLRDAALIQQTGGGNGFSFQPAAPQGRAGQVLGRQGHRTGGLSARLRQGLRRDRPGRHAPRRQHGRAARRPPGYAKSSSPARSTRTTSPTSTSRSASPTPSCRPSR